MITLVNSLLIVTVIIHFYLACLVAAVPIVPKFIVDYYLHITLNFKKAINMTFEPA